MLVARKEDHQYPTPKEWRDAVLEVIGKKRGAQADLARKIGCAPATLNELLHNGTRSHLVPAINRELGWPAPKMPATGSPDQHEVEFFMKKMGRTGREVIKSLSTLEPEELKELLPMLAMLAKNKQTAND